jgi:hypothetical protein
MDFLVALKMCTYRNCPVVESETQIGSQTQGKTKKLKSVERTDPI